MKLKSLLPAYQPIKSKNDFDYTFTIFVPVYNRADTLHRVFESLEKQTFKDFEVIIINDGSEDNSHEVIENNLKNLKYKSTYINNKQNKHKMACLIQAISLAKGELFLPFDSDDECTTDALRVFFEEYDKIPIEKKNKISGITCLCNDEHGNLVGEKFETSPFYSSTFKNVLLDKYQSEKWGFIKTNILKGIKVNEKIYSKGYIPEGTLWILISKLNFETIYINKVLRTYYLDTANRISNQNHKKDAFGMMLYSLALLNWFYKEYFLSNPKVFVKRIYSLLRAARYLDFKLKDYLEALESKTIKFLFLMGWPFKCFLN